MRAKKASFQQSTRDFCAVLHVPSPGNVNEIYVIQVIMTPLSPILTPLHPGAVLVAVLSFHQKGGDEYGSFFIVQGAQSIKTLTLPVMGSIRSAFRLNIMQSKLIVSEEDFGSKTLRIIPEIF